MTDIPVGAPYVRKSDGARFVVRAVTGAVGQYVTLAFRDRPGVVVVGRHELAADYAPEPVTVEWGTHPDHARAVEAVGRKVNEVVETWACRPANGGLEMIPPPKVGDVYVRAGIGYRVIGLTGDATAVIRPEVGPGMDEVPLARLATDYVRRESVAEAAERGYRPLLDGDPTFPTRDRGGRP